MAKFTCTHCKGEFDESAAITGENGEKFCCGGCKNVYYFLNSNGLGEFYSRLGKQTHVKAQNNVVSKEAAESFLKNYVKKSGDICEIYLIIEGIHCSACIWLNEKVLANTDGVLEASINATTNKARIRWRDEIISLEKILNIIVSIGYNPIPYDPNKAEKRLNSVRREFYAKMLTGVFCTMNIMWIAIALYGGYFSGMDTQIKDILHFAEFVLASPVLFYTGSEFFRSAVNGLKNKIIGMDLSVSAGALITYFYSVYAMLSKNGEVYFDSVAMIITFVFAGKFLEVIGKKRAVDSLDGLSLLLSSEIYAQNGSEFTLKSVNEIKIGDKIMVRSGERVQIDGKVISGAASFDLSSLNGESIPALLKKGDEITSGALCIDGSVIYVASKIYANSMLNKIISLLENASFKKPKIERLANQIAGIFSLLILLLGLGIFVFWLICGAEVEKAIITAVSVIIIACPCALGLATPVATLSGLGAALKKNVIFKEASILETIARCDTVIFDKTGTLSKGKLKVISAKKFCEFNQDVLYSLASASSHPVSVAVREFTSANLLELENIQNIVGMGIKAKFEGVEIKGGSAKFVGLPLDDETNYYFSVDGKVVAKFTLEDELKDDARDVISALKANGYKIALLTGDTEKIAKKVAHELGISEFYARANPLEKAKIVERLNSHKSAIFCGDGINDLAALKLASVGICMGSGAGVSVENSDVVLLKDDLKSLEFALNLGKFTFNTVKQNLAFSLIYNAITIPLAICGFIIPLFAAISMSLSSLIVVLNSAKIRVKFKG